jgi:hypothetical protein
MICKLFTAGYIIALILFVHGLSTIPQQNSNGSQEEAEKINADYRAAVLASAAFKETLIGIGLFVLLVIVNMVYKCYSDPILPHVMPVFHVPPEPKVRPEPQAQPKVLPQPQPQQSPEHRPTLRVPDHTVLELKPMFTGPHITHLPASAKVKNAHRALLT